MARPTNKAELLEAAADEFDRLWAAVDLVPVEGRERPGACEAWSEAVRVDGLDVGWRLRCVGIVEPLRVGVEVDSYVGQTAETIR